MLQAQEPSIVPGSVTKYTSTVTHKVTQVNNALDKKTTQFLTKMLRFEKKLKRKVLRKDAALAARLFSTSLDSLGNSKKYFGTTSNAGNDLYDGYIDTLNTTLSFLKQNNIGAAKDALLKQQLVTQKFANAEQIKTYLNERKQVLWQKLGNSKLYS
jgi:hypothetical protein